jgi:hypothetical protein
VVHTLLLAVHVTAGVAGLLMGPAAIAAARGNDRTSTAGVAYLTAVTALTVAAAGLVALRPGVLWPFLLLAVGTEAAVIAARRARTYPTHVRLVCGSYVSLVTAVLVVSWGSLLAWVLPTVVGTVLVERAAAYPPPTTRSKIFS